MKPEGKKILIKEFDKLCKEKKFKEGPFIETFGDGYGEPYNPNRYVKGVLKNNKKVWSVKK
jgi:hypothetical protein